MPLSGSKRGGYYTEKGAFACPIGAYNAQYFALLGVECYALEGVYGAFVVAFM